MLYMNDARTLSPEVRIVSVQHRDYLGALRRLAAGGAPEVLPLVIIEALSTRTRAVLSDHPISREYCTEYQGVRVFPAGSAEGVGRDTREARRRRSGWLSPALGRGCGGPARAADRGPPAPLAGVIRSRDRALADE
jgi:hypothetical protein